MSTIGEGRLIRPTPAGLHLAIAGGDVSGFRRKQLGWITDQFHAAYEECLANAVPEHTAHRAALESVAKLVHRRADEIEAQAESEDDTWRWSQMCGEVAHLNAIGRDIRALIGDIPIKAAA